MKKKCTIELFSGLESFSNVARGALIGHSDFFTIDNDPFFNATFQIDILAFKYKEKIPASEYMVTHIWASPPCTQIHELVRLAHREILCLLIRWF